MDKESGNSGISWLTHPKKLLNVENKCSSKHEKIENVPNDSIKKTKEGISAKEGGDKNQAVDCRSNGAAKKRRSRKKRKGIVGNGFQKNDEIQPKQRENTDNGSETQHEGVEDLKTNVGIEDELINKLRTNLELYNSLKHLDKVFNNTSKTGKQKKKILSDLITFVESMNDKKEIEALGTVAGKFKDVVSINNFKKSFASKCPMESLHLLDQGLTGYIYFGYCVKNGNKQKVAIKKPKFLFENVIMTEAMQLSQFNHKNIIKLIAVSFDEPKIALEYMELGSLVKALKNQRFTDLDLINVIKDVVSGMEYLHSLDYIHADLACRNVLVNIQKECKICDFGNCEYVGYTNGEHLRGEYNPLIVFKCANIPPEVGRSDYYSKSSDVWAMGIFIYEMYELASGDSSIMFIHMKMTALKTGAKRLQKPSRCPKNIWTFTNEKMLNISKEKRTNFSTIREKCDRMIEENKNDF